MSDFPQFNRLKPCRHGLMLYNFHDQFVGQSLERYGEFSEGEAEVFRQLVGPGQVVIEVGANIGAHTVLLSRLVGPTGAVLAFEPQRIVYQTLMANMALNSLTNVHGFHAAAGKAPGQIVVPALDHCQTNNFGGLGLGSHTQGELVQLVAIDQLQLPRCDFIKIDVEGMEQDVLEGAAQTLAKHTPLLYVENDRQEKSLDLIRCLDRLGYKMFWHTPLLYHPNNFAGNVVNVFDQIVSINMLCLHRDRPHKIEGLPPVEVPGENPASIGGASSVAEPRLA